MKKRGYILLALAVFLLTLVLHAPAATVYAWLKPKSTSSLQVYGLQGTLMRGRFTLLTVNGRQALQDTHWHLKLSRLPLLRLAADVESSGDTVIDGAVSVSPFGTVSISNMRAVTEVKALAAITGSSFWPLSGHARLDVKSLVFRHGHPKNATGIVQVDGLAWTLAKEPLELGDFEAHVETKAPGDIVAQLASTSGPLELTGEAKLAQDHTYDLHLQMRLKAEASPQLQALIQSLGPPDTQAYYHLRQQGTLQ